MHHVKMAAFMFNVWYLAYRTHSVVFVRHRFNLLGFLFSSKDRSYVFSIMLW